MKKSELQEVEEHCALIERAKALGIDPDEPRCYCEPCRLTGILCTASMSALEMAIAEWVANCQHCR